MVDFLLIFGLGFLGSFGHCASMCGPITAAFALSTQSAEPASKTDPAITSPAQAKLRSLLFHLLLNLGRVLSYVLTGAVIGALGSVLIASGQLAGVGSGLRQAMTLITGSLLIGFGLSQIRPNWLKLPILHPLASGKLHQQLSHRMVQLSFDRQWWTPFLLGLIWGLIPCGFLYTAQIKAAETGNGWQGALTLLAFGLGTVPTMIGVGVSTTLISADRRSQLFRLGGWITLTIGVLTLLRTGNTMVDYTGHLALLCLLLALVARPLKQVWPPLLRYRRIFGVAAFVLSVAHTLHMLDHAWNWNLAAITYMLPQHQWGLAAGFAALLLITPAAVTSFDRLQQILGKFWRWLHLLAVPALILAATHCILSGSHYLGSWQITFNNRLAVGSLIVAVVGVLLLRVRWTWTLLALEKFYGAPSSK